MCFHQEIHTAYCAELLAFDAAAREHHVCDKAYPAPTPVPVATNPEEAGPQPAPEEVEDRRCRVHSCCRVTTELIFECAAMREARAAGEAEQAEIRADESGEENTAEEKTKEEEDALPCCGSIENSQYREVVFVPFGAADEQPARESTKDREDQWEVLWEADGDEGYAYAFTESSAAGSRRGSGPGQKGGCRGRKKRNSETGSLEYVDEYDCGEDDDEDEDEPEFITGSPYMEFWTFSAAEGGPNGSYSDVATAGSGPGGKVFVCFDNPPDLCELQVSPSGNTVVRKWADGSSAEIAAAAQKAREEGERAIETGRRSWFGRPRSGSGSGGWWWRRSRPGKNGDAT